MRTLAISLLLLLAPRPSAEPQGGWWGFAMGMYPREAARQGLAYPPDPAPLRGLGAQSILLSPAWEQHDVHASTLSPGEIRDSTLRATIRRAHEVGLEVTLAPWIALREAAAHHWRGVIEPDDVHAWWANYERFIVHYAQLASQERVAMLAIGSELTSMQDDAHWRHIARAVRRHYSGPIAFVANHDALPRAPFEAVDVVGVSAYFPLAKSPDASADALRARWALIADDLQRLRAHHQKPVVIFEVGYPSRDGGAVEPWNDVPGTPVDLEEQRMAYQALDDALRDADWLDGLYFWTWFGPGGPHDRHYTVRGKPSEDIARRFLATRP